MPLRRREAQIATGIRPAFRYSESKRNPTDYDSRAAEPEFCEAMPEGSMDGAVKDWRVAAPS